MQLLERLFDDCALYRHSVIEDSRGKLVALEGERNLPFPIARVYYLYGGAPGADRGFHAHRDLQQWAVCVAGGCTILIDDGRERREVRMDSPDKGLLIGSMMWREMRDFTSDAVLMVLASAPYEESDYIRSYDDFLALARS